MSVASTPAYYDFQGLSALHAQAIKAPEEAVGEVAGQFEALFVQMMLKSMRDATIEGGLLNSSQMEVYEGMFDQQISLQLSSNGVLGLSDILVEQLDGTQTGREKSIDDESITPMASLLTDARRHLSLVSSTEVNEPRVTVQAANSADVVVTSSDVAEAGWSPASPEEFVRGVWDHAVNAAKELGLDPLVLVAQSALETGWGKKVIQSAGGVSSLNLFGVKADDSWRSETASVNTLEFHDGVASMEKASFRVYDSIASSFEDYVSFLKSNPRYQYALEKVADTKEFLTGLQDAGYATDPGYADKIMGIIDTSTFGTIIDELKNF